MTMTIMLMVQVLLAVALIALILIQRGRGADTGAAFGSGASTTVFGARGSASFLSRSTSILAVLFFANCFVLSYLGSRMVTAPKSIMEQTGSVTGALDKSDEQPVKPAAADPAAQSEIPAVGTDTGSEVPTVKTDPASADGTSAPQN